METTREQKPKGFRIKLKIFGSLLKFVGLATFGITLGLIIISSHFGLGFITELSFGFLVSVSMIVIGTLMERIFDGDDTTI